MKKFRTEDVFPESVLNVLEDSVKINPYLTDEQKFNLSIMFYSFDETDDSLTIPEILPLLTCQETKRLYKIERLNKAAPELLEACKYVVKYHREQDSGEGELFGLDFVTACISAIRKAEGKIK